MKPTFDELFENIIQYPDFAYQERLNRLVGLDENKEKLTKVLSLLVNPEGLDEWIDKHHKGAKKILDYVLRRPPLVVLEGDVGSGKTELATTIGDAVARQEKINIQLFPLSLSARGQGLVGEITKLISAAFDYAIERAKMLKSHSAKNSRGAIILLVDEADALTQSRENSQMHHEDRAGVNSFIRGIDRITNSELPIAVIMCTNRMSALDPAIRRRAAEILSFYRPTENQREAVLKEPLLEFGFTESQIKDLVKATGKADEREYGFTFSDLTQRLLPSIVLDAYPDKSVTPERAKIITAQIKPTPPFKDK